MTGEECTVCGGDLVEEELDEERESKIRENSPGLEDDEDLHAFVCQECGHVAYRRS